MASDDDVTEALARIGEGHGSESVLRAAVDVLCRRVATLRAELAEAEKREHANRVSCEQNFALLTDEREAHKLAHSQWCSVCDERDKLREALNRANKRLHALETKFGGAENG